MLWVLSDPPWLRHPHRCLPQTCDCDVSETPCTFLGAGHRWGKVIILIMEYYSAHIHDARKHFTISTEWLEITLKILKNTQMNSNVHYKHYKPCQITMYLNQF